jgi:uncharacterized cupredoxin-like copper-binding protein
MSGLTRISTIRAVGAVGVAAAMLVSCASDGGSSADGGAATDGATTVDVTVQEFSVNPSTDSAPAGEVIFSITNDGPDDIHELVVIRTDLDPAELPTDENGAVDEEGEGVEVVDEIEEIPVGETQQLTVTLEAGSYALICNRFDQDENEAHYEMGMHAGFEATE